MTVAKILWEIPATVVEYSGGGGGNRCRGWESASGPGAPRPTNRPFAYPSRGRVGSAESLRAHLWSHTGVVAISDTPYSEYQFNHNQNYQTSKSPYADQQHLSSPSPPRHADCPRPINIV
ncbi:hypothetical protein J6590_008031 [Homalodisca vitripennis]|nr:hypothetical protein J6590_008031 [Homalodisca vitripennis]